MKLFGALVLLALLNVFPVHADDEVSRDPANENQQQAAPAPDSQPQDENARPPAQSQDAPTDNNDNR
jgi:hypothetical protein